MKRTLLLLCLSIFIFGKANAQCDPEVPTYVIDLSANPDTTWVLFEADAQNRNGQCCGVGSNENCIQFLITLHPNAAGIFFDYDGAGAFGSLNWREDCGTPHSLKDTICVTTLSFTLTFCKPGSDNGNYTLISVPKPTFPEDQFVPMNCVQPVEAIGVTANTVTWQSISPGAPGAYDSYMSCTDCLEPVFTPNPAGPTEIEYRVCGYPLLDYCVGSFIYCDTVKFTVQDSLKISISPTTPAFCAGDSIMLTAAATGGDGVYNYIWYNSSLQVVGTGATYYASVAGSYTCEVRDGNYEEGYCDGFYASVPVAQTFPPVINAGADQVLCAQSPNAAIIGTYQYAAGITWSGGAGTFVNGIYEDTNVYIPTTAEINAGVVTLTLSSSGVGGGCVDSDDQIQIFFVDTVETDLSDMTLLCDNGTISINPTITGGVAPFSYSWTNGINTADNNLGEGTYCLTIVDGNTCQTTHCLTISAPPAMNLVMSSTPVTVDGGSDGTATASISGGVGPYTYLWNTGGTTATITGLPYGIYTVTVTDANGCEREGSVVVNEPRCNGYSINTSSTNVSCFDGNNGSADVVITGGSSPFTFLWNDPLNQITQTATNLSAGVYTVVVTDANNCDAINTATITEPSQMINTMSHVDVTIQGGNDGSAQASVTGGTGGYSYSWSSGGTTDSESNLIAGVYYLTITDGNSCQIVDSVQISEPPCNEFYALIGSVSPLCYGASTASANLTLLNGVGPYSITWSTGQTDVTNISGILAGFHSVQITDSRGCEIFQTYGVSQPSELSIGITPTPPTCNGEGNGTIDLSISGGTYPYYNILWSNGATTEDQIDLDPGNYSVVIEDLNGCTANDAVTITDPAILSVSETHINATCFGYSDGSIDVTVSGGTVPYSYNWSNGATTQDLSNIDLGGYILNLSDANNCSPQNQMTVYIEEPEMVEATTITIDCPSPGSTTTTVTVVPNGGNADYSISTDGGSNYGSIGVYTLSLNVDANFDIVVKDINDCISIVNPISIDTNVAITDVSFNTCYILGQTTETITASITGGTSDYSLSTDGGSNFGSTGVYTSVLTIDSNYDLVAQDSKGCISESYGIILPDVFDQVVSVISDYNGTDISCFGFNDGSAQTTISGGTSPYSILWSNAQSSAIASNLVQGTYTVQVTDDNGCVINGSVTLNQPAALSNTISSFAYPSGNNISCNGLTDGSIDLEVSGGNAPYIYAWSNSVTTQDQSLIGAGTYDVIITDLNGCELMASITLSEPASLTSSVVPFAYASGTNISCKGESDGSIDLTTVGGSTPYTFAWSNSQATEDISGLLAGTYDVTVTDINGCTTTSSATLSEPAPLIQVTDPFVYTSGTNISCNGEADGSIDLTVTGGNSPYTINWSNGAITEDISSLTAGTYSVTVVDVNGCSVGGSETLSEPASLGNTISSFTYPSGNNISCNGLTDGSIDLEVSGGNTPYTYSWSNSVTTQDQSLIGAGTYDVTIIDLNGCELMASITLSEPASLTSSVVPFAYASGTNISCNGEADGSIDLTVNGGSMPYSFSWSNSAITEDVSSLLQGVYDVTVTDVNGCTTSSSATLSEPAVLTQTTVAFAYASGTNISCNGQNDGSIDLTVTGGNLPYSINWSNGATTENITSLVAGTYTVSIVDVNGCSIGGSETLLEPTLLENTISAFEYSSGDNISCFGYNDGSIDLEVTGGNAPYTYNWSNGEVTQDLSAITADTYDVTVTDLNGCVTLATITLTEPSGMSNTITAFEYPSGDEISCEGLSDGSIDLTINGGVAPYTYLWSNSETSEDLTGLSAGTYSVVVTEVNGCTITTSITLVEPTTLVLSDVSTNPSCYQFSNGDIDVTVSGGSPVYTYVWSTGASTEDLTDLTSGSYSIVATDINGCEVNGTFVLTQPDSLSVELESPLNFHDHNISLYGANDGMIYSTVNGGTTPYVYSWSNGSTEADLTGLVAGIYVVEIIDAQGCYATDTITLTEPFELELPTIFTPNQDGDNDLFDIHGIEAYPNNDLTVVNRWGNVVYTEEGYHNTWAGTHMNGEELPDGVYFVILKINGGEIEKNIYVHIKRY